MGSTIHRRLAQADISIAMGKGSDIAIDTAGMSLISSDLQQIPKALALSRSTVRAIRQNLFWAFIYNLIGIPLAAGYPVSGKWFPAQPDDRRSRHGAELCECDREQPQT